MHDSVQDHCPTSLYKSMHAHTVTKFFPLYIAKYNTNRTEQKEKIELE